jgi:hypothetical protein
VAVFLLLVMYLAHTFACLFYLMARVDNLGSSTWVAALHLVHGSVLDRWAACLGACVQRSLPAGT